LSRKDIVSFFDSWRTTKPTLKQGNLKLSYIHFTIDEREIITVSLAEGKNKNQIAKKIGRPHSSVAEEIKRNSNANGNYSPGEVIVRRHI